MDHVVALRPAAAFVARTAELERLQDLSAEAARRRACAVLVAGDAGVGKTSLIGEFARRAAADGRLVLLGRCVDLGTGALPYLPFAEALSQLVRTAQSSAPSPTGPGGAVGGDGAAGDREGAVDGRDGSADGRVFRAAQIVRQAAAERPALARIAGGAGRAPAERAPGDTGLDRLALFEAVAHVLGRIGDDVAPLLLVIEDLHWADASTRDLVRFLLARLGDERLMIVATYRSDDLHRRHPMRPLLGELLRLPSVHRLELRPFADDEMAAFLGGVSDAPLAPELVAEIAARSAGNAYYAEELLAAGAPGRLPAALADVLLDRMERLSPAGQQVVRVASVLGAARIEDPLLRSCLAAPPDPPAAVHDALREVLAHQLLVPDGPDRYAFRHALLQEAVYGDLLPGERVRLHATAARELARLAAGDPQLAGRTAADQARHAIAAHDLPLALEASLRAAREAGRRSAPAEALAHYEQVLTLWPAVEPQRRPSGVDGVDGVAIVIAAAGAAGDAGLNERAVALAREAVAQSRDGGEVAGARARAALAFHTYAVDDPVTSRQLAREVVADLAGHPPEAARVLARSIEARVDVSVGNPQAALEVIPEALEEAEQLGLLALRADLLTSLATAHGMAGLPGTQERWAEARAAAERAGDEAATIRVLYNTAIDRTDAGDLTGALDSLAEGLAVAEAAGMSSSIYGLNTRALLIELNWHQGRPEAALAAAAEPRLQTSILNRQLQLFTLPVYAVQDPERVLALDPAGSPGDQLWHRQVLCTARAEALSWVARFPEAVAAARAALEYVDAEAEPYRLVGISIATTAVAALAGEATRARERHDAAAVARAATQAQAFVDDARARARLGRPRRFTMGPEGNAWLARLDQEVARLDGTDDPQAWGDVARAFEGVSVLEATRARWRRIGALVRDGRRDDARAEFAAAREGAVRLGAAPLVAALDDLARRGRFEVAPQPGEAVLTRRERDVMELVAAGLTNRAIGERLFISEKTASVHVSNVLAKLGASGRTEAVAIIGRHGLLD
jgi:DNA-binding CsgD family transcriptional regulator/tetratricopeptide (TPR) repeat protein